jgi:hypothetical protein
MLDRVLREDESFNEASVKEKLWTACCDRSLKQ